MAVQVKNIEREFLLTTAMREHSAILMSAGGGEWTVKILAVDQNIITLIHDVPLRLQGKGVIYDFRYTIRDQSIAFKAEIIEPGEKRCGISMPDKVYKNLSRRFIRLPPPGDLGASFAFAGERYDLNFPPSAVYNPLKEPEPSPDFNPADLRGLMAEFERKALSVASDRGIVMFKDRKPENVEEQLVASTGRCFCMSSNRSGLPKSDPFAERTILTRDDFLKHFIESGMEPSFAENEVARLERAKRSSGVISELIVPILFQDYTIGYASIVNRWVDKPAFDLPLIETFVAFARVFSWSLKLHGYFKGAAKLESDFRPLVVDVSAGGLLFMSEDKHMIQALKEDSPVSVRLVARKRTIDAGGTIRRLYTDTEEGYFGIEFQHMAPEDFRFLFEYLYGRPYTDEDSDSIEGVRAVRL